jgi:hypothetical protein
MGVAVIVTNILERSRRARAAMWDLFKFRHECASSMTATSHSLPNIVVLINLSLHGFGCSGSDGFLAFIVNSRSASEIAAYMVNVKQEK